MFSSHFFFWLYLVGWIWKKMKKRVKKRERKWFLWVIWLGRWEERKLVEFMIFSTQATKMRSFQLDERLRLILCWLALLGSNYIFFHTEFHCNVQLHAQPYIHYNSLVFFFIFSTHYFACPQWNIGTCSSNMYTLME